MALKYYYDLMSQPCRAVYMFLRLNKIPHEEKKTDLRKGEHRTEEFITKVNPFQLVPAINDNGFRLTESIAIVEYLMNTRKLANHWYPPHTDPKRRARVTEYLHWQHFNTRGNCASLFQYLLIIPRATGKPVDQTKVAKGRESVRKVIKNLESYYLRDTPFISSDVITAADIFGACELMQLYAVLEENLYESSPIVKAWMERVRQETNPVFDDAHKMVYRVRDMYKGMAKL
ncbi:glutathione S-transferase theta-1-like isoform X2 [Littorina saxatilis]|uniref:Uncharacterized protein n=1 Tax=Littorina saxatilis TaxID=31220 RepID=A0AAN9AIY2_9CAEN